MPTLHSVLLSPAADQSFEVALVTYRRPSPAKLRGCWPHGCCRRCWWVALDSDSSAADPSLNVALVTYRRPSPAKLRGGWPDGCCRRCWWVELDTDSSAADERFYVAFVTYRRPSRAKLRGCWPDGCRRRGLVTLLQPVLDRFLGRAMVHEIVVCVWAQRARGGSGRGMLIGGL